MLAGFLGATRQAFSAARRIPETLKPTAAPVIIRFPFRTDTAARSPDRSVLWSKTAGAAVSDPGTFAPRMEKELLVDRSEVLARDQRRMRAHDWTVAMALCMGMAGLALFFLIIWL